MLQTIKRAFFRSCAIALVVLVAGCGGGTDADPSDRAGNGQPSGEVNNSEDPCDLLTKGVVEEALGVGELTLVEDDVFSCAYGSETDEAQVTIGVGQLVGGSTTFEESRTGFHEALGEDQVRDIEGIGQGAFIVDNGPGGGFFATALGDGNKELSIYIYPAVDYGGGSTPIPGIDREKLFQAAEQMLATAVPLL